MTPVQRRFNHRFKTKFIETCNDLHIGTRFLKKRKIGMCIVLEEKLILLLDTNLYLFEIREELEKPIEEMKFYEWKWGSALTEGKILFVLNAEKSMETAEFLPYELKLLGII